MNRFSTMNGVTAARAQSGGMQGTTPTPVHPSPQQPMGRQAPGVYAGGGQSAVSYAPSYQLAPGGGGMMGTMPHADLSFQGQTEGSGVQPGQRGPNVPQAAPPPAFDPNDPNNAALAGYMAR